MINSKLYFALVVFNCACSCILVPSTEILNDPEIVALLENETLALNKKWFVSGSFVSTELENPTNNLSKSVGTLATKFVSFNSRAGVNKAVTIIGSFNGVNSDENDYKRTYIGLRLVTEKPRLYSIFFIYMREKARGEGFSGFARVHGKMIRIEYDNYDDRLSQGNEVFQAGWKNCGSTILFSCKITQEAKENIRNMKHKQLMRLEDNNLKHSPPPKIDPKMIDIVTAKGFDSTFLIGMLGDLDIASAHDWNNINLGRSMDLSKLTTLYVKQKGKTPTIRGAGGSLAPMNRYVPGIRASYNRVIRGFSYEGLLGTKPIFLPESVPIPMLFVPDQSKDPGYIRVNGVFFSATRQYMNLFITDSQTSAIRLVGLEGTLIPIEMDRSGLTGGFRGKLLKSELTGSVTFEPQHDSDKFWFNPRGPEANHFWIPDIAVDEIDQLPERPRRDLKGNRICYGALFKGVVGSMDVFVRDGESISGVFVLNDPSNLNDTEVHHGVFQPTKPVAKARFYPDDAAKTNMSFAAGAFMPDDNQPRSAIPGAINKRLDSFTFTPNEVAINFQLNKELSNISQIWMSVDTKKELVLRHSRRSAISGFMRDDWNSFTPPSTGSEKKSNSKKTFSRGVYCPGFPGSQAIFIPNSFKVEGILVPQDPKFAQIAGTLMTGNDPKYFFFEPTTPTALNSIERLDALFVPNGIAPGQALIGGVENDHERRRRFYVYPECKGYFYIDGSPSVYGVWTPFQNYQTNEVLPPIMSPTDDNSFLEGVYIVSMPKMNPVFIPNEGCDGVFMLQNHSRINGAYYPHKENEPSYFIEEKPHFLKDGVKGIFFTECFQKQWRSAFSCFFQKKHPKTLLPTEEWVRGWSNLNFKKRSMLSSNIEINFAENAIEIHETVDLGGGFKGYPTMGKGISGVLNPNSKIFQKFLSYIERVSDRLIKKSQIILADDTDNDTEKKEIIASLKQHVLFSSRRKIEKPFVLKRYISLQDFKKYVTDRYIIKKVSFKQSLVELAIPKEAEQFLRRRQRKININLNVGIKAEAEGGSSSEKEKLTDKGYAQSQTLIRSTVDGKLCERYSSAARADSFAEEIGSAHSKSVGRYGGVAISSTAARRKGNAHSEALVEEGGIARAYSTAEQNSKAKAYGHAVGRGNALAISESKNESTSNAAAIAKQKRLQKDCDLPDEIIVVSQADSNSRKVGPDGLDYLSNSHANANVKVSMTDILVKLQNQIPVSDDVDLFGDIDDFVYDINISSVANSAAMARFFEDGEYATRGNFKNQANFLHSKRAGWKTQLRDVTAGVALDEHNLFYGLGSCPSKGVSKNEFANFKNVEEIIDFILRLSRNECSEKAKLKLLQLYNDGFFHFNLNRGILELMPHNFVFQKKLAEEDLEKLSIVHEAVALSLTYEARRRHKVHAPNRKVSISRSISFLTKYSMIFIDQAKDKIPNHFIRLIRNLIKTLQSVLTKLSQDEINIRTCKACSDDQLINRNDRIQVMAIVQFLIKGLEPVLSERNRTEGLFESFYRRNEIALSQLVDWHSYLFFQFLLSSQ